VIGHRRPIDRVVRFSLVFVTLQIVVQAAFYGVLVNGGAFRAYLHVVTASAATLLRMTGRMVISDADALHGGFDMSIRSGCDGLQTMAIFAAAVAAYPSSWTRRLAGALAGMTVLFGVNILRIATLFVVGARWPQHFQAVHVHVWPALLVLCAVILWVVWASRIAPAPRTA
jgi:exosortase/archaeosortase family protein